MNKPVMVRRKGKVFFRKERRSAPLVDRFWSRVEKTETCWLWRGPTQGERLDGQPPYGKIGKGSRNGGSMYVHRLSWELHYGLIPQGMLVCHHCDNTLCVRPDHLFIGTYAMNSQDMAQKGRAVFQRAPAKAPMGIRNGQAKLDETQVIEIIRLIANGLTQRKVATTFGISKTQVGNIARGKSWSHLLQSDLHPVSGPPFTA